MDRTPPEIWTRIFLFACRDTGYTGRSLSLVSKYIHETSKPVKLQSISVQGHNQMLAFAALLERTPPHLRRIRYLFVSSHDPKVEGMVEAHARHLLLSKTIERLSEGDALDEEAKEEVEALRVECECQYDIAGSKWKLYEARNKRRGKPKADAFETILRNVASTLEILEVNLDHYAASHKLENLTLPSLTDLTTHGDFPLVLTKPHTSVLKPCHSLRSLHVAKPGEVGAFHFLDQLSFAPSLSHLRFSGLQQEWFAEPLGVALGITKPGVHSSKVTQLPATMEMILIQPSQPPPSGGCGNPHVKYHQLLRGCRALQKQDKRVVLLQAQIGEPRLGRFYDAFEPNWCDEHDWLDRVNGGEGCRDTSDVDKRDESAELYWVD